MQAKIPQHASPIASAVLAWIPDGVCDWLCSRPALLFAARIAVLLAFYVAVDRTIMGLGRLGADGYAAPHLSLEVLRRLQPSGLVGVAVAASVVMRYGALGAAWHELELGRTLRWFVTVLAIAVAWPLTTFGYNYYFDQAYTLDRVVLGALVALIWLRPLFIYPFLLLAFTIMWQFGQPALGGPIFAHKLQVLHVLNLFAAAFLLHAITGMRRTQDFWFLTCCLVAAAYWVPVIAKLELDWFAHGHLYRILPAAYAHGWLGNLDAATIAALTKAIAPFDWPMRVAVLIVEGGCLVFLWRRWWSVALLAGVIVFHTVVFALYGFLFWTWMVLDGALLVVLLRTGGARPPDIYTRAHLLVSIGLIATSGWWAKPAELGWLDTRLTYTYRVDAVDVDGNRYPLAPQFFAPYEDIFTMSSFAYLVDDRRMAIGPYGITKLPSVAAKLMQPLDADQLFVLESRHGVVRHDPTRVDRFQAFVTRFVVRKNERADGDRIPAWVRAPPQFWSLREGEVRVGASRIDEIVVTETTSLYDDAAVEIIRTIDLLRIPIPGTVAPL